MVSALSRSNGGFSVVELLLVATVVVIIGTFTMLGVARTRSSMEFSNAARTLQAYCERAVMDAKRRHALGAERAIVEVVNTTSYKITADFNEDGTVESRTVTLPPNVTFEFTAGSPPKATIDRHGNIAEGYVTFSLKSSRGGLSDVKFTSNGDAGVDTASPTIPLVSATPTSSDAKSYVVLTGTDAPKLDPSPTPMPTPLPYCAKNDKPAEVLCRCETGEKLDKDGRCK